MKRIIFCILSALVALALYYFVGTGFTERNDIVLTDYSVSEDGRQLTFATLIPTSMGYIRGFKDDGGGVKPHYLTFYATFGGVNSDFGAKHVFTLDLGENDKEIYFNRPGGGYELVLRKDTESGTWERP